MFNLFYNRVCQRYACFNNSDVDWDGLYAEYIDEVAAGVSRGRYAAILGGMSLALGESHTKMWDRVVNWSEREPGLPLLFIGGGWDAGPFGAATTTTDDGEILVYKASPDNPLGLAPGDVVLGYEGRPWLELVDELLGAGLPVTGTWGCSDLNMTYGWNDAVLRNWHLFATIDVRKYDTGAVVHLPTSGLQGYESELDADDRLDIGLPRIGYEAPIAWGVIERQDARIGVIHTYSWSYGETGDLFDDAVAALVADETLEGLIVDFRINFGGSVLEFRDGYMRLFPEAVSAGRWTTRCNTVDRFDLCTTSQELTAPGDGGWDKPIAVLCGPQAVSAGDDGALVLSLHPEARTFGRRTAGAFNSPSNIYDDGEYICRVAVAELMQLEEEAPVYLTHVGFPVDEEIWLRSDDVAVGFDTVLERAATWILGSVAIEEEDPVVPDPSPFRTFTVSASPNPFNPIVTLRVDAPRPADLALRIHDARGRLVRGIHLGLCPAGVRDVVWDGRDDEGRAVRSGAYLVQLRGCDVAETVRVVLLR